jgi:hypothetical protein
LFAPKQTLLVVDGTVGQKNQLETYIHCNNMVQSNVTTRIMYDEAKASSEHSPIAVQDLLLNQDSSIWKAIERENELLKKVEILLEKRLRKEAGITRFGFTWFAGLFTIQIGLVLFYVFLRGNGFDLSEGSVIGPLEQIAIFVGIFLGFTLFDVFNLCVCPDKGVVYCEKCVAKTHVIIAAHRAAHSLEKMLPRILAVFAEDHVWVADNGYPDEETQKLCRRLGVHYRYNSIGNKANALLQCAIEIKESTDYDVDNGKPRSRCVLHQQSSFVLPHSAILIFLLLSSCFTRR